MIREAIILAGGLGTRLQSVVNDLPKSLAPVAGKPFLNYLLAFAKQEGIQKFIFALGHRNDQMKSYIEENLPKHSYVLSVEDQPLGTGGAIYKACAMAELDDVIVLNADTYFGLSFQNLSGMHERKKAACTLALKRMNDFDRYGVVEINDENRIIGFSEKKYHAQGLINGGVYALSVNRFLNKTFPPVFSFEKDYLEKEYASESFFGVTSDSYFIDIGVPEDYKKAQTELNKMSSDV